MTKAEVDDEQLKAEKYMNDVLKSIDDKHAIISQLFEKYNVAHIQNQAMKIAEIKD